MIIIGKIRNLFLNFICKSRLSKDEADIYSLVNKTPEQMMLLYLIESYSKPFLTFLPRNISDFSSHGIDHTQKIISKLNCFVPNWNIELTQDEALLLYLASWVHDIGCIKDRERHHEVSANLLLNNTSLYESLTDKYAIPLKYIVLAHRSQYPLDSISQEHNGIRLRMICAIFRLMDACEICYSRCPKTVFEVIKDSFNPRSREVWIGHMNILNLKFSNPEIQIFVNDIEKCQFLIDDLLREIKTINDTFEENGLPLPTVQIL
jgi:exopolyphosphatase/pppGpp-phosphohydrolase